MMITVLIPTANRPAMLRTALRSVASQTKIGCVVQVLVIENLNNRASEIICREFPTLPIVYIYRDPPLPPGIESAEDALRFICGDHIAILFDDDWWTEQHLERSIENFLVPDAVASYGAWIRTTSEDGYWLAPHASYIQWFAANEPQINNRWKLELPSLIVAALLGTAFHFSTLVIKTSVWTETLNCIRDGNPYDTDRLMSVEMGLHGKVVVDNTPHAFIRTHPGQEALRLQITDEAQEWFGKSTDKIINLANSQGIELRSEFLSRMSSKAVTIEQLKQSCSFDNFRTLLGQGIVDDVERPKATPLIKRIAKELAPPCFWKLSRKFFNKS